MSRILEALKQIEARKPPPGEADEPHETPAGEAPALAPADQQGSPVGRPFQAVSSARKGRPTDSPPAAAAPQEKPSSQHEPGDLPDSPVERRDPGFRALAANILALLPAGRPAALLFTSPGDGDGKTTTLAPLAALLAERVSGGILAVDCNAGRPRLAEQFGVAGRVGLRAVLRGDVPWQEAVRATGLEGLRVLPALPPGPGENGPVDLSALVPLLEELRRHYRLVLLDAASLVHPELAPLVRSCEGTCLVVRLGQTTSGRAKAAVRAIRAGGGRLLGCVVTGVPREQ